MSLNIMHVEKNMSMLSRINTQVNNSALATSPDVIKGYGMESLDNLGASVQQDAIKQNEHLLKEDILSASGAIEGCGLEAYSDAQVKAGAIAMTIGKDLAGYAAALNKQASFAGGRGLQTVTGSRYGSANPTQGYGAEAFEQAQEFTPRLDSTVEYNIKAAKQDPVGESFFPTTTITANDMGMDIKVPVDIVEPFVTHKATGEVTDWKRKKLINALRDPSMLRNEATQLIPYKPADKSNDKFFADGLDFVMPQAGEDIPTAPLKMGVNIGYIGLCSTPGLVKAGSMDYSDQIDSNVRLRYVWLEVKNASGTKEVFRLRTDNLDRSLFQKSQEGDRFETSLDFQVPAYQLTSKAKTVDGADSALLAPLTINGNIVALNLALFGKLNHEKGSLLVNQLAAPHVSRVYDVTQQDEITNTTSVQAEIAKLTFTIIGYHLKAQLRNSNFRTRDQRIDRQTSTFKYMVQLGAPITAVQPPEGAWGPVEAVSVEQLVTATYARNSAMAISRLLDYVDSMRSAGVTNNSMWQRYDENSVEGVGKAVVDPWFGEGKYDISKLVNSTNSHTRREDVSEQLLNIIRTYAYRMNAESGYNVALHLLYNETTPTLLIGTDMIIAQYLMETGDLRTAGISFKVVVVTTNNIDMRGKIVMTLSRMKAGGLDLLTFGMHLWVPEIVATVRVMRNGTYVQETMVQPRNLHVVVCPLITYLEIVGLDDAYNGTIRIPVTGEIAMQGITKTTLDGLQTQPATK